MQERSLQFAIPGLLVAEALRVTGLGAGLSAGLARWRAARAVHDPGKVIADLAGGSVHIESAFRTGAHRTLSKPYSPSSKAFFSFR
jgi:hypothetical protein